MKSTNCAVNLPCQPSTVTCDVYRLILLLHSCACCILLFYMFKFEIILTVSYTTPQKLSFHELRKAVSSLRLQTRFNPIGL